MAKQISQDTFDTVVRENMEEFDMSRAEAVRDAVEQFEAQGVDLSTMLTDETDNGGSQAAMRNALEKILSSACDEEKVNALKVIQAECDIDLPHRVAAGKMAAYDKLSSLVRDSETSTPVVLAALQTLCSLCDGQPDFLEDKLRHNLLNLLRTFAKLSPSDLDLEILALTLRCLKLNSIMHEVNRQTLVQDDVIPLYVSLLDSYSAHAQIVRDACAALRVLTLDDDPRATFGKAHEHAKSICSDTDALRTLVELCPKYSTDQAVLAELFSTLSRLAVRNEFCQRIADLGGIKLLLQALQDNISHQSICKQALLLAKSISGNDEVKKDIVACGGVEIFVQVQARHIRVATICEAGCATLAALALRCPQHCDVIVTAGGHEVIVHSMQLHPDNQAVQKAACRAVRNLVARTTHLRAQLLGQGVEELLQRCRLTHTACGDEVKAALRDLGCKVELQERWTGEGHALK